MKIAVYHNLPSGGAKRAVSEQITRLSAQHSLTLYSLNTADHRFASKDTEMLVPNIIREFHPLPMAKSPFGRINPFLRLANVLRLIILARKQAAEIDAQGYDVVLLQPCQFTQAPVQLLWLRTPSVYYCQELPRILYEPPIIREVIKERLPKRLLNQIDIFPKIYIKIMRGIDRACGRRATILLANSRYTSEQISKAYNRQVNVCYLGVDTEFFKPLSVERKGFVLSVGALKREKGFDFIIHALNTIPISERPRLIITSNYQDADELKYLQMLAHQSNIQVEFLFNISETELRMLYAQAACVAYAPIREPFGLVPLEAMAMGTPVVGVREGGIQETIVDGISGISTPREPDLFGSAIRQLISQRNYRENLGKTACGYVIENWSWENHIVQLSRYLENASLHSKNSSS